MSRAALTPEQVRTVFDVVAAGRCDATQLAAFLALMRAKGETGEELAAMAAALRDVAVKPDLSALVNVPHAAPLVDIVGTGGDGHNTVNISTAASVVASACGARVVKHGNRSASSMAGAADVLEKLGIPMLGPSSIAKCVADAGVCFLMAPLFHPALAHVAPVRKALGVRTVFNFLGPLLNPAEPKRMVLGVYSPTILEPYAEAVASMDAEHALIVHCCGLDELAPIGKANIVRVKDGKRGPVETVDLNAEVGVPPCTVQDLKGGDAAHNARVIRTFLAGGAQSDAPDVRHVVHTVALNAGAVLHVSGLATNLKDGYERALACIHSGAGLTQLDRWAAVAQKLKQEEEHAKKSREG